MLLKHTKFRLYKFLQILPTNAIYKALMLKYKNKTLLCELKCLLLLHFVVSIDFIFNGINGRKITTITATTTTTTTEKLH